MCSIHPVHWSAVPIYWLFTVCWVKNAQRDTEGPENQDASFSQPHLRVLFVRYCYEPNAAAAAKSLQSCPTLCDPIDGSPPGSPVPGILQARTLERVVISFSRGTSRPRDWTQVSHIVGRCFTVWATREALISREALNSFRVTSDPHN